MEHYKEVIYIYNLSRSSRDRLLTCHPMLILLVTTALAKGETDISVVCGTRRREEQQEAVKKGFSKLNYPYSKHNKLPSIAVDLIPYPGGYNATEEQWRTLEKVIKETAKELEIPIIWGGDWKNFVDKPHWELK